MNKVDGTVFALGQVLGSLKSSTDAKDATGASEILQMMNLNSVFSTNNSLAHEVAYETDLNSMDDVFQH